MPLSKLVHRGLLYVPGGAMIHMSTQFSTFNVNTILDTAKSNVADKVNQILQQQFVYTCLMYIAAASGFIVGVVSFTNRAVRNWYNNGGKESTAKFIMSVLHFVNTQSERLYYIVEDRADIDRVV